MKKKVLALALSILTIIALTGCGEWLVMKKFLLVVFVGMVLAINIYGIVNKIMDYYEESEPVKIDKGYITVYME